MGPLNRAKMRGARASRPIDGAAARGFDGRSSGAPTGRLSPRRAFLAALALALSAASAPAGAAPADEPGPAAAPARNDPDPASPLESRVRRAPATLVAQIGPPGRPAPTPYDPTDADRGRLRDAVALLTPLHRRVLAGRLRGIYFLENMPCSAIVLPSDPADGHALYDVAIDASVLPLGASEWLTRRDRTCFDAAGSALRVEFDLGGDVSALAYVLLHEATHIVDLCEGITPEVLPGGRAAPPGRHGPFTAGVWSEPWLPAPRYRDEARACVLFYAAPPRVPVARAEAVYASLGRTPFASLYAARNWRDDLAEYATLYHLTEVLKHPYRIVIRDGEREVFAYEPMKADLVRGRAAVMRRFYDEGRGEGPGPGRP